jgi:hypothetical protein
MNLGLRGAARGYNRNHVPYWYIEYTRTEVDPQLIIPRTLTQESCPTLVYSMYSRRNYELWAPMNLGLRGAARGYNEPSRIPRTLNRNHVPYWCIQCTVGGIVRGYRGSASVLVPNFASSCHSTEQRTATPVLFWSAGSAPSSLGELTATDCNISFIYYIRSLFCQKKMLNLIQANSSNSRH